ncbi:probable disease resistance protein At5g66900 [Eucalyptus grandis]|uniref:probable disease resistance protein At5g66900 n=1 Tax=Eucalyptus grandis TaxID=71139 RepID=UPI00192EA9CA|nr:probable disease resistance protein At5g66900 [Eucalyptus grandis]
MKVDFAGGGVGTAFNELFTAVKEIVQTVRAFGPQLKKIENTLRKIEPIIKEWDEFNKRLDRNPTEMDPIKDLLDRGKGLIERCKRIRRLHVCKKYMHSKKLKAFNAELLGDFKLYIQLLDARNNGEMLWEVKEIKMEVKQVKELICPGQVNGVALQSGLGAAGNLAVPDAPDFIVGSVVETSLRKLREQLLEEGVSVIVVTAPGGCGKTTLLKKLCHDKDVEGKFNNIMFVPVSKKPTLTDIVQKMFQHNGLKVPEIVTEDDAVHYMQQLLIDIGQSPVLLVLDDVWTDSQSIIEKFVFKKIKHYKIVVTSRYEFPHVGLVHHLNPLPHGEALELFRQSVAVDGRSLVAPDDDIWDKIVNRCKGLPLALTVVAKSLRGKDRSFWETKLLNLSRLGLDSDILDCLRKSLDDLDGDPLIKEHFMDLGSFPEDRKIPATALIDMWVALYGQDFNEMQAVNDLHELVYRNLADLVITRSDSSEEEDKCYSSHYATQHDLLRELAIMECNQGEVENRKRLILDLTRNNFPNWWSKQKQPTLGARLVSISTDGRFSTPWPNLQLPEAEALVLNIETNQTKTYALPEFIEKADKLKVLIVTNYSFFPVELCNFHVVGSSLRRIRLERVTVSFQSMGKLRLDNLQKISFFMCDIGQASTSIDAKISYAMPKLVELDIDYCNDLMTIPDSICEIKPLKKLSITNCHNFSALPEQLGQSTSLEVVRLNSCTNLLQLPNLIGTLQKLTSLNISDCLNLSTLPNQIGQLDNLKKINIRGCLRLSELPRSIVRLRNLKKVICDQEREDLWKPLKNSLSSLNIMAFEEEPNLDWLCD